MSMDPMELDEDLVIGADQIARFMGMSRAQIYKCVERGTLPTFKIGARVCARRSVILAWIAGQEGNSAPS